MSTSKKLTVIIPIYNEAVTCAELIRCVKNVPIMKQIIVVNDGSTDGTREILETIPGIELIHHEKNQGKGSAVQTAIPLIKGDQVILQDGDLEYDPGDFIRLLKAMEEHEAEVVFGSRWLDRPEQLTYHTIGNKLITWFSNRINGQKISDVASCYKLITVDGLRSLNLKSKGFGLEAEFTAKVFRKGLHVIEIPINYTRRNRKEGKKLRLKDGLVAAWSCLWFRFFD